MIHAGRHHRYPMFGERRTEETVRRCIAVANWKPRRRVCRPHRWINAGENVTDAVPALGQQCLHCTDYLSQGSGQIMQETRHSPNIGLTLGQRQRRWPNGNPTLGEHLVLAPGTCPLAQPLSLADSGFNKGEHWRNPLRCVKNVKRKKERLRAPS